MEYNTQYEWYAVSSDLELQTNSNTWNFKTKTKDKPSNGGGESYPSIPPYLSPKADASNSQTHGLIGEAIEFDGSESYDYDGNIVNYSWDFNDGNMGFGEIISHIYTKVGTYSVKLTVTDNDGLKDDDIISVLISKPNTPPSKPTIDGPSTDGTSDENESSYAGDKPTIEGPTTGHKDTSYEFTMMSIDIDNDTIQYIIDWGDGNITITDFIPNGTAILQEHYWAKYGIYTIIVKAFDGETESETSRFTIYIDILPIDDIIKGFLIDENSDNIYDLFENSKTGNYTGVVLENITYLIDVDGDSKWDYVFNSTGVYSYYLYLYEKYIKIVSNDIPGFELISVLTMVGLVIIILKRRR